MNDYLRHWLLGFRSCASGFDIINKDHKHKPVEVMCISIAYWAENADGASCTKVRYIHRDAHPRSPSESQYEGRLLKVERGRVLFAQPATNMNMRPYTDNGDLVILVPNIRTSMVRTKVASLLPEVSAAYQRLETFFESTLSIE